MARALIQLRWRDDRSRGFSEYPLSPASFLTAVVAQGVGVALLLLMPVANPAKSARPIYESEIRPNEKRIIWYNLREVLPTVNPRKIGTAPRPQGEAKAPQTVIATSPNETQSKQFAWQPSTEIKMEEIESPNLVAVAAPPVPPAPRARTFIPPAPQPKAKLPDQPTLQVTPEEIAVSKVPAPPANLTLPLKSIPRRFVAPAASKSKPAEVAPVLDQPPPPAITNVNAAIVSLNPADQIASIIPPGSRPAQFSAAANIGAASSGLSNESSASVPLLIDGGKKSTGTTENKRNTITNTEKPVLYQQIISGPMPGTFSAPLRPGSRRIPSAIEARFHGRDAFTIVIPAPKLAEYGGDWILWFAERAPVPGETGPVHAPIPYRKHVAAGSESTSGAGTVSRIQAAVTISSDGHIDTVQILTGVAPDLAEALAEDLKKWEFRPGTLKGIPIDMEAVIEIPFRGTLLATADQPH